LHLIVFPAIWFRNMGKFLGKWGIVQPYVNRI
jgi:hypothetical protein